RYVAPLQAGLSEALRDGLCALVRAQLANFPGNLFWDFDYLAIAVTRQACCQPDPRGHLEACFARMVELQTLFGQGTPIRFRYVHDFAYGYDWAKWVQRAPEKRQAVGPFDWDFLTYMHHRGHELLALIEADDSKYPRLRDTRSRNPFGFSREPEAERILHADLAARGLIPVANWDPNAAPTWKLDYASLRLERASVLGFARPKAG
ncbi:MAG: ferrochelatase, partial [Nannocystaceae bacterium]